MGRAAVPDCGPSHTGRTLPPLHCHNALPDRLPYRSFMLIDVDRSGSGAEQRRVAAADGLPAWQYASLQRSARRSSGMPVKRDSSKPAASTTPFALADRMATPPKRSTIGCCTSAVSAAMPPSASACRTDRSAKARRNSNSTYPGCAADAVGRGVVLFLARRAPGTPLFSLAAVCPGVEPDASGGLENMRSYAPACALHRLIRS